MTIKAPWSGEGRKSHVNTYTQHAHTTQMAFLVSTVIWPYLRNTYDSSEILFCPNYTDT